MDERVRNGGIAGAIAFVGMALIGAIFPDFSMQGGTESAVTVLLSTGFAYFKRRSSDRNPS